MTKQVASAIRVEQLSVGYVGRRVLHQVDTQIEANRITALCGPNGCGKSTLLRAMAGLIPADSGTVYLGDTPLSGLARREMAQRLALLAQFNEVPAGLSVYELVSFGRYAHTSWLGGLSGEDHDIVLDSLARVGLQDYAARELSALSGGERQRAWIAMALAQDCPVLLLDEPTTWLDIHHQIEVLEQLRSIQRERNITLVWVLHDLHQAASYSDHILLMRGGRILHTGDVESVMDPTHMKQVYEIDMLRLRHPQSGAPLMIPAHQSPLLDSPPR
ncbi:ABC transporter ATP-binding protein [Marinobacterium lacunae]|uniref:ABC transporter ATP-binding protein n=1 Tax=Marinobacterium lacunae TaxID=1232683 RepID=UPI00068EBFDC|nr:ABC transporter ATP-binding protein [Marinobacterium lacunae]